MSELLPIESSSQLTRAEAPNFFRESPISSRIEDTLQRYPDALRLAGEIRVAAEQSPSAVIAVVGEFGSGKSSVVAMAMEELRKTPAWLTVDFDPYMCLSPEGVVMDFFTTIAEAFDRLPRDSLIRCAGRLGMSLLPWGPKPKEAWQGLKATWEQRKLSQKLGSFLVSLGPFGSAVKLGGVDLGKATEAVGKRLATEPSARSKKEQLARQLEGADKNIAITIDDIDRLQPKQQALIFNLLRIAGGLPRVYFCPLFNEQSVRQALIANKTVENEAQAQTFLEKFIQFRHEIPPISEEALERHVLSKFEALAQKYEYASERLHLNTERFTIMYREGLRYHLTRPRLINRFFAEIDADIASMPGEVNIADYCGIHFLRCFAPAIYDLVHKKGASYLAPLLGAVPLPFAYEDMWKQRMAQEAEINSNRQRWMEAITAALPLQEDPQLATRMLTICSMLFPAALYGPYTPYKVSPLADLTIGPWKGVSTQGCFDRYFNRGLNPAERAEMIAWYGIQEVIRGQRGPAVDRLTETLRLHPSLTIAGMDPAAAQLTIRFPGELEPAAISGRLALIDFFTNQYMGLLYNLDDDTFLQENVADMERLVRKVLERLPANTLNQAITTFDKYEAVPLIGNMLRLSLPSSTAPKDDWKAVCTEYFRTRHAPYLHQTLSMGQFFEAVPANKLVSVLFAANKLAKPGELATMIWDQYLTPGRLSLETFLGKILVLDPRHDFKGSPPSFLAEPLSIQHEIRYKLQLLLGDKGPSEEVDILQANELIIDTLLGLNRTMETLPPFLMRDPAFYHISSARGKRLREILIRLQLKRMPFHD